MRKFSFRIKKLFAAGASGKKSRKLKSKMRSIIYVIGFSTWKQYLRKYFSDSELVFINKDISREEYFDFWRKKINSSPNCQVFIWGFKAPDFIIKDCIDSEIKLKFVEDGFIRSVGLGATKAPPMSLCLDAKAPYFDSRVQTDLEYLLQNYNFEEDSNIIDRARNGINLIVSSSLSKYNHISESETFVLPPKNIGTKRILVLGQVEDDASIKFCGNPNLRNIDAILLAAKENPQAEIFYKPHPDVLAGFRFGGDSENLKTITAHCTIIDQPMMLSEAFVGVDHVYTISSLGGLEALFRGIKVTVLGAPFYSGWGLTDDRIKISRRTRKLTIEQLFAVCYLIYPRYFDPESGAVLDFESASDKIIEQKLVEKTKSVKNTSNQVTAKKDGISIETLEKDFIRYGIWDPEKPVAVCFAFADWRYQQLAAYMPEYNLLFCSLPPKKQAVVNLKKYRKLFCSFKSPAFVVLGMKDPPGLDAVLSDQLSQLIRVEDGFIRGIGVGANVYPPLSLIIDKRGMYFNSREISDLEFLIENYNFEDDQILLKRAEECINRLVQGNHSKYNKSSGMVSNNIYGEKTKRRVLVIGQVEDDASIQFGADRVLDNNALVQLASLENPDCEIIYKPHPDVLRGNRKLLSNPKEVESICTVLYAPCSIHQALETIDHVYTITSLAGFEALLRGIPVTTLGAPFYAGWGLTDTRQDTPRRTVKRTVQQLFAAAYILYPHYRHPITNERLELEQVLDILDWMKEKNVSLRPKFVVDPGVARSHHRIFSQRLGEGRYVDALEEISSAIMLDPENYRYYAERARVRIAIGEYSDRTKSDLLIAADLAGKTTGAPIRALINYLASNFGVDKEVVRWIEKLLTIPSSVDGKTLMWAAAIFNEIGRTEHAIQLYKDALARSPNLKFSARYLNLLYSIGKYDESLVHDFDRVKLSYESMLRGRVKFESWLNSSVSIAVVGNSPINLGSGNGDLIDSHDIVVRFNNYNVNYPFKKDYGCKTSVWVRTGFYDTVFKRDDIQDIQLVVQSASHLQYSSVNGVDLIWSSLDYGVDTAFIPNDLKRSLSMKLEAPVSAGLSMLSWIYARRGPLPKESVFGFSLDDQFQGTHNSYHYDTKDGRSKHNWSREKSLFLSLFD